MSIKEKVIYLGEGFDKPLKVDFIILLAVKLLLLPFNLDGTVIIIKITQLRYC